MRRSIYITTLVAATIAGTTLQASERLIESCYMSITDFDTRQSEQITFKKMLVDEAPI